MSSEQRLILLLSRISPSADALKEADTLLRTHQIDFERMLKLADMNGVSPLLYRNLKGRSGVPEKTIAALGNSYFATFSNNARHSRETLRIIPLLKDAGVEAIPLKGSLFSDMVLGDMGLYPTGDIDLLVRPRDLGEAKKALLASGYHEVSGMAEEDQRHGSYHLTLGGRDYDVELHWNLVMRYVDAPPEFWWEETTKRACEGTELTLLCPESYLLYGIFRLFSHGFRSLRFLVLIAGLAERYRTEIRPERLISLAEGLGMKRVTFFTLGLLRDLLGQEVFQEAEWKVPCCYGALRRFVVSGFFSDVKRAHLRMSVFTVLLDSPAATLGALFGRVLPHPAEIRLRYGLSPQSKKLYAYYLLNPILLLLRRK